MSSHSFVPPNFRLRSAWLCSTALTTATLIAISGCGGSGEPPAESTVESQAESTGNEAQSQPLVTHAQTETLVNSAVAMIGEQNFGEALKKLNQAIELDRDCAEAYFQRAGILADARNYD
ncbi:hypothetical protein GC176_11995, partial [bacterium]|nr:hypothetical protein [bacterium]